MNFFKEIFKNVSCLLLFSYLVMPAQSQASGTVVIDGTVRGFDQKMFSINHQGFIYTIDKAHLTVGQKSFLKSKNIGQAVAIEVPFSAVTGFKFLKGESRSHQSQ